jgi:O-antigen ligase
MISALARSGCQNFEARILVLYAVLILISMATMSLGAALVILASLGTLFSTATRQAWQQSWRDVWSSSEGSNYRLWTSWLATACLMSLLSQQFFPLRFPGFDPVPVHWAKDLLKLWYFLWIPLLASVWHRTSSRLQTRVWQAWLLTFLVISAIGIFQFFTGWPRPQAIPHLDHRFHATLFLGHHLSTSSIWIFPFFAALAGAFSRPLQARFGLSRAVLVLASTLGGITLFLSFSRMLWLALPLGLALFGLLWIFRKAPRTTPPPQSPLSELPSPPATVSKSYPWLRLASLFASGLTVIALIWQIPAVRERLLHSMGTQERIELWKANWNFFLARPVFGVGWHHNLEIAGQYLRTLYPDRVSFVGHAHNNLLDVLGSLGAFGLMGWLGYQFWLTRLLIRQSFSRENSANPEAVLESQAQSDLARGWLAAWLVFHCNGLTNLNFWEGKVQHQLAFMTALLLSASLKRPSAEARVASST